MIVPNKNEFLTTMQTWTGYLQAWFTKNGTQNDPALANQYYDGEAGAYRLSALTHTPLDIYKQQHFDAYAKYYVIKYDGRVQGFRNFTDGFLFDIQTNSTRRATALSTLKLILANGAYVATGDCASTLLSRECAYALQAYSNAIAAGIMLTDPELLRKQQLNSWAVGHITAWNNPQSVPYYRPFMGALTCKSIINADTFDIETIGEIEKLMEYTWATCWKENDGVWGKGQSFLYTDRTTGAEPQDGKTTPELNILIAPVYAWLWSITKNPLHWERANRAFQGGIAKYNPDGTHAGGAYLGTQLNPNGKFINQQLFWIDKFFDWLETGNVLSEKQFLLKLRDEIQTRINSLP